MTAEHFRINEAERGEKKWRRWGTYLSERQWGTVREDYSANGDAWGYLSHDAARSRAYRWGEDGLLGLCDNRGLFCFSIALWNHRDPFLKERLFGLTNPEGNHGEDVKECYYYLDATPTHSYARGLYKYPQSAFPYDELRERNAQAGRLAREIELTDTAAFDENRYFDVSIVYAKADFDDVLIEITVVNHGPEAAPLTLLPTFWLRNTWSWGDTGANGDGGEMRATGPAEARLAHPHLGEMTLSFESPDELVFTGNETNRERLFHVPNTTPYVKDAFHRYIVEGDAGAVDPAKRGTKAAAVYALDVPAGATVVVRARFASKPLEAPFESFGETIATRAHEADEFFAAIAPDVTTGERARVFRQSLAGLLWSKQYYNFDVTRWLRGDPGHPPPPRERHDGRNARWQHLYNSEVIAMPDKWEYPWYAAWDTCFHAVALATCDPSYAKSQLVLLLREWFMHPNGQLPAYEWALGDVNPPVHAWAALRVYRMERKVTGIGDRGFLESVFHKLMLNFTWWVNRKDAAGRNVFEGGFLGLDNIGVFDRSSPVPAGGHIEQADATSWMGMYCLNLLAIALELARENRAYEDVANKFFEHFLIIAHAINDGRDENGRSLSLWDDTDGFYYDALSAADGSRMPLRVRSMVGVIPLFGVGVVDAADLAGLEGFGRRVRWFLSNRPELAAHATGVMHEGESGRKLLSLVSREKIARVLSRVLDSNEFLSPYGIRGLSRFHRNNPYVLADASHEHRVGYEPAESESGLFGGNSNWRGPVWFPLNFLLIESLRAYDRYYGASFQVEFPTGSGVRKTLGQVADVLAERLIALFLPGADGRRPAFGDDRRLSDDPNFRDYLLFYEYFHGDNGRGMGASHQTGWTSLVANLVAQSSRRPRGA